MPLPEKMRTLCDPALFRALMNVTVYMQVAKMKESGRLFDLSILSCSTTQHGEKQISLHFMVSCENDLMSLKLTKKNF